ncbi:acetate/propionate family kinase [Thermanaeromonas sp. C210]|uniref:acetate/propionate family kinase n=1 Tax=Thermanaeromonas sp. C210 TaxID=2731925 RepID=UPI00155C494E|nr:acetate kinase [Thermanaeromonas sp. C210]GFN23276.1 acetate kinase [Thermanaeromonas sp. C210]
MQVLAINCGGSSVKYKLFSMPEERVLVQGRVEGVGGPETILHHLDRTAGEDELHKPLPRGDYGQALEEILKLLRPYPIEAVGHRVVHGGASLRRPARIDDEVLATLKACCHLAPLHNPANIAGIEAVARLLPEVPQVAVCDNTFHLTLPPRAYLYGLPYEFYERYGIRRYGFHGITFSFMVQRAASLLGRDLKELKIVSLMLGSGTTANACLGGESVDVSTGFTPTEGLLQSTRCGDVDPGVLVYLLRQEGLGPEALEEVINKRSGWLGISGVSNDYRAVEEAARRGHERARIALDVLAYRAKKYIGAYAAAMGGIDVLIFSGGVGERSSSLRREICRGLEFLGIELDAERNEKGSGDRLISSPESRVKVLVVHTDEEVMIARETVKVLTGKDAGGARQGG